MNGRRTTGTAGEALAARHLQASGYRILATGWRCPLGEIDIIAIERDDLVFVEVRSRYSVNADSAFESVDARKQAKLLRLADAYMAAEPLDPAYGWRIDVVAVTFDRNRPAQVEIIRSAVGW